MAGSSTVSGSRELHDALIELGKATGKNTLRRAGKEMLEPMAEDARAGARRRSGDLAESIHVGTRLAPSQRGARGRYTGGGIRADPKNSVTLHMGPGQQPQAITEEFGTFKQAAHPFMRPAFDLHADAAIHRAGDVIWEAVSKAAARRAKKLARSGGGA